MKGNAKSDYVDELRKINILEKLPQIKYSFEDAFSKTKIENNKFIRYKEEPNTQIQVRSYFKFLDNPIIKAESDNQTEKYCKQYEKYNEDLTKNLDSYQDWSNSLNQQIKTKSYDHRFFFENSTPPPRHKDETLQQNQKNELLGIKQSQSQDKDPIDEEQAANLGFKRQKYNFPQINNYYFKDKTNKEDNEIQNMRDDQIKKQIAELRKLKDIDSIDSIGKFQQEYSKFNYYIQPLHDVIEIQFVQNSIFLGKNNLVIDYFRQIGAPSRHLESYTDKKFSKKISEDNKKEELQKAYDQQKKQLFYLYHLNADELKVNKNHINFFDIVNVSMGRMTSKNSLLCIRSEKVTYNQYKKLQQKMAKYDIVNKDNFSDRKHIEVMTDQKQEDHIEHHKIDKKTGIVLNVDQIIDQINNIRKWARTFASDTNNNKFNKENLNSQIYLKLQSLLSYLYESVVQQLPNKYSLEQISNHLDEVKGNHEMGHDRKRLLWFIVGVYNQMLQKKKGGVNLRNILQYEKNQEPKVSIYKGKKMIKENAIQSKKVYGFPKPERDQEKTPIKTRTTGKIYKTPLKATSKTPIKKNSNYIQSTTTRK